MRNCWSCTYLLQKHNENGSAEYECLMGEAIIKSELKKENKCLHFLKWGKNK